MAPSNTSKLPPFVIDISDEVLTDLKQRLNATRWSIDLDNDDESYGISTRYRKCQVQYWIHDFD